MWENRTKSLCKSVSDIQLLIKHSFLLSFLHELLMSITNNYILAYRFKFVYLSNVIPITSPFVCPSILPSFHPVTQTYTTTKGCNTFNNKRLHSRTSTLDLALHQLFILKCLYMKRIFSLAVCDWKIWKSKPSLY